jgi:hypothetical protein
MVAIAACALVVLVTARGAGAAQYPPTAEAVLLLDGTQGAPYDGFNMQIDTNGFSTPDGTLITTHMFCVESTVTYRCGIGANDLLRVQGPPSALGIGAAEANQLAWLLTHRGGYDDQETQYAIWCITNPGDKGAVGQSDQLCHDAEHYGLPPDKHTIALAPIGATSGATGTVLHFSLTTDAPSVDLSVDDDGALPTLCGSAPDNAHAAIVGSLLVQQSYDPSAPARQLELCVQRAAAASVDVVAALPATATNLQAWQHPTAPTQCQGLIDTAITSSRTQATIAVSWHVASGALRLVKQIVGPAPANVHASFHIVGPGVDVVHTFPDGDSEPWAETFSGLTPGSYSVTEADTGGAATTVVQITGDGGTQAQTVGTQAQGVVVVDGQTTAVQFVNTFTSESGSTTIPPTTSATTTVTTTATTDAPVEPQGTPTTEDLGELPHSGGQTDALVRVAVILLLAGGGLVAGTRRRAAGSVRR